EVGIIVLGVLIALSAEQAVQSWEWRKQADEARTALRVELGDDNLPQAYARLAIDACLQTRLVHLQAALDHHVSRAEFASLANDHSPPNRTWDDATWKAVGASGVLSHGGSGELVRWSLPYSLVVSLAPISVAEREDLSNLRSTSGSPGELTSLERDR